MAKRKSVLADRLSQSLKNHANDETVYNQEYIDLPPGIKGGIAKFVDGHIGEYQSGPNKGKQFVYMAGIVVEPKGKFTWTPSSFVDGKVVALPPQSVEVVGQRTSMTIPLCDTTNSQGEVVDFDSRIEQLLNEFRKLGADTTGMSDEESLGAILEALEESGVYFKFGTSGSTPNENYPEQRTWENWYGNKGLEDYEPDDDGDEVDEEPEPDEITELESDEVDDDGGIDDGAGGSADGSDTEELTPEELLKLALTADSEEGQEGDDAVTQLTKLAQTLDLDPDEFDTWTMVAQAIIEASGGSENEEEQDKEEEQFEPEVGDVCGYRPQGAKSDVEVEVKTVNKRDRTCRVKNLDTGKLYTTLVSWDKLKVI